MQSDFSIFVFFGNPIEVVEYHRIHRQCTQCGNVCAARWSDEIIPGQDLGVRLQALIGWLGNYAHMPYSKIRELIQELGQIDIGEGTLVATNERVAIAIEKPVQELGDWVKIEQPNVHVDETPWAVKGVKEWLWVVAHKAFCVFRAADTRSRAQLESLLGTEYRGVLSSDDFSVYNGYPAVAQQKCLAHMLRHFKSLIKSPGLNNAVIGEVFVGLINDVFNHYRLFQTDGDIKVYTEWACGFKSKLTDALNTWIPKAGATALNLLSKLRDKYDQWWYFLDHPEVPPDNNLAERSLRLAVTKRKISGGSRSLSLVWRHCKPIDCRANLSFSVTLCYRLLWGGITRTCWSCNCIPFADSFFCDLNPYDPQIDRTKRHKLIDIMTIAVCAVICGADGWVGIETYGCAKYEWLKTFLELPNGIPSHDTFARVFAQINPQQFQSCFLDWMKSIQKITSGEVVAIDGKSLRNSYDKNSDQSAIQMVSAWATTNKLVLGQVKVNEKSNEITAIPELLKVLELSGCLVTIDAIGCQKEIVKLIALALCRLCNYVKKEPR